MRRESARFRGAGTGKWHGRGRTGSERGETRGVSGQQGRCPPPPRTRTARRKASGAGWGARARVPGAAAGTARGGDGGRRSGEVERRRRGTLARGGERSSRERAEAREAVGGREPGRASGKKARGSVQDGGGGGGVAREQRAKPTARGSEGWEQNASRETRTGFDALVTGEVNRGRRRGAPPVRRQARLWPRTRGQEGEASTDRDRGPTLG